MKRIPIPGAPLLAPVRFTILAPPRSKKNSGQIKNRGNRRIIAPSDAWIEFRDRAVPQLRSQWVAQGAYRGRGPNGLILPIDSLININARFYLDADRLVDVQGLYESLADTLKVDADKRGAWRGAGILLDDHRRILQSWDGSRVIVDRACPRVEILIEPVR